MKIEKMIEIVLSLPKSVYFNFKAFDFKTAMHLPVIVSYNTKLGKVHKDVIHLNEWDKQKYHISFGFGGSVHIVPNRYSLLSFGSKASITFNGKGDFAKGCVLRCDYGKINFGKNISVNRNCCFNCEKEMNFGNDVLFGWNVTVRDTDGHQVFQDMVPKITQKPVNIGDHVWVCSYSDLLKGTDVGNNCVISWRSCVIKPLHEDNVLIGGSPATILQRGIDWEI